MMISLFYHHTQLKSRLLRSRGKKAAKRRQVKASLVVILEQAPKKQIQTMPRASKRPHGKLSGQEDSERLTHNLLPISLQKKLKLLCRLQKK